MSTIEKIERLTDVNHIINASADLMSDVYTDPKMSASEKLRGMRVGQQVIVAMKTMQLNTMKAYTKMGLKVNGELSSLTFQATED